MHVIDQNDCTDFGIDIENRAIGRSLGITGGKNGSSGIVKDQHLREIKQVNYNNIHMPSQPTIQALQLASDKFREKLGELGESLKIFTEQCTSDSENDFDNDINDEEGGKEKYEDFRLICDNCIIADVVGCKGCGIFQYAINREKYDIKVRRI